MSKEINIQIINTCQLDCTWCGKHWHDKIDERYMDTATFKQVVDKCVDYGIDTFCLTPMHGELTNDCYLDEKIRYLESHSKIKHYFFATNLLNIDMIGRLYKSKKLHLEISLYGYDKESYLKYTNKDYFNHFTNSLVMFATRPKGYSVTIYVRFSEDIPDRMKTLLKIAEQNGMEISYNETHNYNWGGLIPEGSLEAEHPQRIKTGVCPTASTGCIFENGDVGLCYMNDIDRTFIFGNILEDSLSDIFQTDKYREVINNMSKNVYTGICEKCNERF